MIRRPASPIAIAALFALALALAVSAGEGEARAQELPAGKFGFAAALRQNTGPLGGDYGFGWMIGMEAGYQPTFFGSRYSLGAAWELLWGRFNRDDADLVARVLTILEMNFGLRFRLAPDPSEPRFITLAGGATLLRTNVPVPPDQERVYLGPYVGIGVDQYISNRYLFALEARYGMITEGPTSFTLVLSFQFGR